MQYDFAIIGAGIVGAASSLELIRRRPGARILLLEKEAAVARHQSGHNSGVVHAGVYYEPGSLKARFCREGVRDTREFCRENGLPFRTTGKLIVATGEAELPRLEALHERCRLNGLSPRTGDRAGKKAWLESDRGEELGQGPEVLLRQQLRGRHEHGLAPAVRRPDHGGSGHDGLPAPHVPL